MTKTIVWDVPIETVSEMNCSEHHMQKYRRHKKQKERVRLFLKKDIEKISLPCHIKLTRKSPRTLDYDNLVSSQKYVLDTVCDLLIPGLAPGRADGDPRITKSYHQEKKEESKRDSVLIEIAF
jgi:hypothetical protein